MESIAQTSSLASVSVSLIGDTPLTSFTSLELESLLEGITRSIGTGIDISDCTEDIFDTEFLLELDNRNYSARVKTRIS